MCRLFAGGTPVLHASLSPREIGALPALGRAVRPAALDRVRLAGADIRVITPKPRETRGTPFGVGVEWLALEDRFAFYGDGFSFIGAPG